MSLGSCNLRNIEYHDCELYDEYVGTLGLYTHRHLRFQHIFPVARTFNNRQESFRDTNLFTCKYQCVRVLTQLESIHL